jgi:hypothetical protein
MRGRKPELATGSSGLDTIIAPPSWLSKYAKPEWRRVMPELIKRRIPPWSLAKSTKFGRMPRPKTLTLARPPRRRRITGRNLGWPQRHEMTALVRVASDLRAIFATHVALQLVDRRRLRPTHNVEGDGLVSVAAKAFDFEISVSSIERVAERRRGLCRSLKAEHALVPSLAGQPISLLARFGCPLR